MCLVIHQELIREFGVSRVTIQRDLSLLEKSELVSKVHGGVKLKKEVNKNFETRFNIRLKQNYEKKLEIAKKAVNFVNDGSIIFLDPSSTTYIFAKELFKKQFFDLNIITTSIAIKYESLKYPNLKIVSTGGELRADFNMLGGSWVIDFLEKVNLDASFVSIGGISTKGEISSANRELANVLNVVFKISKEINLLVDSSKFSKTGMLNISPVGKHLRVITDEEIDKKSISELKQVNNIELVF